jgi:PAS domain S-box-containing protein
MNQGARTQLWRYALAIGSVAIATGLTYLLLLADIRLPFAIFYGAVIVAARYGGRIPGLLAVILSVVISYFFALPGNGTSIVVFALVASFIWFLTQKQMHADDELRRRERELTDFFENATVGLHWVGPDGTILWTNRAELEMLGYTREEYIGRSITEFHADEEVISDILSRLSRGEELHGYEARLRCKDGTIRHVVINSNVLWEDGRFVHTRCFTRDITEIKRAELERERAASALRFQAQLLDTVEQAVVATDAQGTITYWNSFAEKLYGWPAAEVLGRNIVEVTPTEASKEQAEEIMARVSAGESWSGEFDVRRRDGMTFPALVTDTPIFDESGSVVGVVGVSVDITERKRAEASRSFLSAIVESSDDAIISSTFDGKIASWNDGAEKIFGYTAAEAIGQDVSLLAPPERADEAKNLFAKFKEDRSARQYETVRVRKDGRLVDVAFTLSPIAGADGEMLGISAVARDISGRKRDENALLERARLAALGADVGAALIQNETLSQMLQRCAETLVKHLDVAFARIWTLEEGADVLVLQASAGMYTHLDGAHSRVRVGEFKIGLIAEERKPHLTNDVADDPRVSDKEWAEREEMIAFAGYPLIVEDRLVGVMATFARRPLTDTVLESMASVANGIALGIERKRAEQGLREQSEIIETVNRVGQTLAGELDLQKLVQAVTDAATEISNAHFGSFFYNLIDDRGESYMLYTLSGVPRSAFAHFPMPRNTDIFAPTFKGEGTVLIPDVKRDPRYGKNSPYYGMPEGHLPVTSYLAVPVVSRSGEVYGGLFFGHPEEGVFTERAARIIEGLAAQAAVAMDNARLFDAVQRERIKAQASEEHYRFLAESIPQIVWTAQPDGSSEYFNQRWYDYTGLSRETDGAELARGVVHPEDIKQVLEGWRRAYETGESFDVELRLRRGSDGSYRWHLARSVPLRDAEGRVVKWFGTSTDIDDRRRAEDAQRFLAEASEVLVSSLDYEATLRRIASLVVPRLADWCAVDMLSDERTIKRLAVAHQDAAKVELALELDRRYPQSLSDREGVAKVIRTGEPDFYPNIPDELIALVARDAEQLSILRELGLRSAMTVPLSVQGRTLGAITFVSAESGRHYTETDLAFAEDLAHRAAFAVENARLYRDAQEVNRLKDEFLATLSHELRTPLTAVLGWTRLLSTGQLDEATQARALETIERNAQAQVQLIDDILDVSRVIRGKLRLNVRSVELAPVIEAAVDSVRPAAEAKGVRLQVVLDHGAGPISGDPDRLQQVVWNLLSNAVKFTPREGRVQVVLSRLNSHLEVAVMDSGQGIEPEFLPYVFDRFRQADPTTTRAHGGLGLGLAIVRHLIELHGGSVKAESGGAGQGATFRVMLPLLAAVRETIAPVGTPLEVKVPLDGNGSFAELECPTELEGLRVLVVEDDADSRTLLVTVLEQCHAEVVAIASAEEAIRVLEGWRADVLISDIEMPGEDGFSLIRRVRQLPAEQGGDIPAAALTAYARPEDRMRALVAGFQIHLPKPVEPAELITVVASLAARGVRVKS